MQTKQMFSLLYFSACHKLCFAQESTFKCKWQRKPNCNRYNTTNCQQHTNSWKTNKLMFDIGWKICRITFSKVFSLLLRSVLLLKECKQMTHSDT